MGRKLVQDLQLPRLQTLVNLEQTGFKFG